MTAILEPADTQTAAPAPAVRPVAAAPAAPAPKAPAPAAAAPAAQAPKAPAPASAPQRRAPRQHTARLLTDTGVRVLTAVMIGLFTLGVAVQPAPDGPEPSAPLYADLLNGVVSVGLLVLLAGGLLARRWSLTAGLVTGAGLLTLSALCPASGHHEVAAWWFVQMGVGVAMTALPAGVLARTQSSR